MNAPNTAVFGSAPDPYKVLVVGESLIDVVQKTDGSVREHCGGSPANVAIALGRLGHEVNLVTWLGKDAYADILRDWLNDSGVNIAAGLGDAPYTPLASAVIDKDGSATYTFDLTWDLSTSARVPDQTSVIHVGSLAATLEPGSDKVYEFMRSAREATTVFDPNIRPSIVDDPESIRHRVERFFDASDVVRASDVDLLWLYPYTDPIDVARRLVRERRPSLVVITQGPQGATAITKNHEVHTPTAAFSVVDRVGAGDAATGGLIDGLSQAGLLTKANRERLADIDEPTLQAILDWCAQLCAYCLSKEGATMARRSDLSVSLNLPCHDGANDG
ncbi:carbohydrate kinase family protein [Rarobacter incanus]|uniref:Fructokinase n=1 Tax=Rarobacter incanus TaxID=153494 RepID=A0A542SNP5_9MICO|nr:carbohydrate kinase [Rarobacter incanus]TQK76165.1 fructokinase [Rarobacter incanus]